MMKTISYMNKQYVCELIVLPESNLAPEKPGIAAIAYGKRCFFFLGLDALSAKDRALVEKEMSRRLGYSISYKNEYCGYSFLSRYSNR